MIRTIPELSASYSDWAVGGVASEELAGAGLLETAAALDAGADADDAGVDVEDAAGEVLDVQPATANATSTPTPIRADLRTVASRTWAVAHGSGELPWFRANCPAGTQPTPR
jgi:hypothetical protein